MHIPRYSYDGRISFATGDLAYGTFPMSFLAEFFSDLFVIFPIPTGIYTKFFFGWGSPKAIFLRDFSLFQAILSRFEIFAKSIR